MIRWQNIHADDCPVVRERDDLVAEVAAAETRGDADRLAYLQGAVAEYDGNGDQEIESCSCGRVPFREVLVHLNVSVPATDDRTADKIADAILGALEVGADDDSVRDLGIVVPLAETTTTSQPHLIAEGDLQAIIESFGDNPQNVGTDDDQDPFGDLVCEFSHALGLGDDYGDEEQYRRLDDAMGNSTAVTMRDLARKSRLPSACTR